MSLTLMILSGSLKTTFIGKLVPVDLTLLGLALIVLMAFIKLLSYPYPFAALVPLFAFVVFWWVHQLIVPETGSFAMQQSTKFLAITLPLMFAVAAILTTRAELRIFAESWLVGAAIVVLLSIGSSSGAVAEANARQALGDDPGTLGYWAAVGFVCCLAVVIYPVADGQSRRWKWLLALGMGVFLYFAIASASRGALLGMAAGVLALIIMAPARAKGRMLVLAIPGILLVSMFLARLPELARNRLDLEDVNRAYAWQQSFQVFLDRPVLGGGATAVEQAVFPLNYSHNLLIDIASGQGMIGLFLICVVFVSAWMRVYRFREHLDVGRVAGLLALFLAGAMVSLDLNNRYLWLMIVAALLVPVCLGSDMVTRKEQRRTRVSRRRSPGTPERRRALTPKTPQPDVSRA